jgi:ribonuclease P protein component
VVPNQGLGSRFAVLIPKRYAKRAVDRHLLKRLARVAHSKWSGQANEDTLVRLVFPVKQVGEKDKLQWWTELQALFNPPSKKL